VTKGPLLAASIAVFMISSSALADDTFFVHRLDAGLRTVGATGWKAGGSVVGPVHVSPVGEVVALVAGERGRLSLVRWSGDGRQVSRHTVELPPPIRTSRLSGGDALVVVAESTLAKVDLKDGRVVVRVPVGSPPGDTPVAASPHGAWFAFPERLVYFGLDGQRLSKARPVGVPPEMEGGFAGLFATDRDTCVLAEQKVTYHPVSGRHGKPDRTFEVALSLVGPGGDVLAQTVRGELTTRWDWFWSEGSTAGPMPRGAGIFRTRYHGSVHIEAFAERADGGFVLVTREDVGRDELRHQVVALDRGLHESWAVAYGGTDAWGRLPPWSRGILLRSGVAEVRSYEQTSGAEQVAYLRYPPDVDPLDVMGTALGCDGKGGWIVVSYGSPERRER
jgi:hypothetical protein